MHDLFHLAPMIVCFVLMLDLSVPAQTEVPTANVASIPFGQVGAMAGMQYSGDGLTVASTADGASLGCAFQRLTAKITTDGMWLTSRADASKGSPFRLIARSIGRENAGPLNNSGKVEVAGQLARFIRPQVTEEYSVGVDGVRQDFVIGQRPAGTGPVRLELGVDGAKAEAIPGGARLVLADGGRKLVYNRLKAEDARGKELKVSMETLSGSRLAVVLEDTAAEYPVRIDPTFSDANWSSLGGIPGANGPINAIAVDGSENVYVGGSFTIIGTVAATNIAEWNGSSWSALTPEIDGPVNTLVVSGTNLYAGGDFITISGVMAYCIAQWNGNSWSALGTGAFLNGVIGSISALAVDGTDLYAAENFGEYGFNVPISTIMVWDGGTWSDTSIGDNSSLNALAVDGSGNVYAGGGFDYINGVDKANGVAIWNGSNWSAVGAGLGEDSDVWALAVSGNNLYAGGGGFSIAGTDASIAVWNGNTWSALGLVSNPSLEGTSYSIDVLALAVNGTNLFVAGDFTEVDGVTANYVAEWDGNTWSALGLGVNKYASALAVSGSNLYIGGANFTTAGGAMVSSLATWNGNVWSAMGSGLSDSANALAVSGTTLYAGGLFGVEMWNGSSWSPLGSGVDGPVWSLLLSGTNLYVGGAFDTAGGVAANCIAQWNGSTWSALGLGMLGSVNALAMIGNYLYAGGSFIDAGGVEDNQNLAVWDGSSWWTLGVNGTVDALAVSGRNLYAGGQFTSANGLAATNVAKWTSSSPFAWSGSWSALGSGVNGRLWSLAVNGSGLYAGGQFSRAGGVAATNIAQWSGDSWLALGPGISGASYAIVDALAMNGTNLFAGGQFTAAGNAAATNIAEWNGSTWLALGSGMGGSVSALTVDEMGDLFAGGSFLYSGTNLIPYIAEADIAAGIFLNINSPAPGQLWSNAAFTVTGTTLDRTVVTGVWYQLNHSGWSSATTANGWTDWTVSVILTPGPNVIQAYAVDANGNVSATNAVSFDYFVGAPLAVSTNGLGSLSTNYNGALLQVANIYAITATAGNGFVFTNWTGGTNLPLTVLTNGTTVEFVMEPNLILQANFVDTNKPAISITNVPVGLSVSNAAFIVRGTARDNWQVTNVFYSVNSGGWSNAVTGNNYTNWAGAVTLIPGTNTIAAYALDPDGNVSLTTNASMFFMVTNQLALRTLGLGSVKPNYSNVWLEIGRNYSITSAPAKGFVFIRWVVATNWLGGTIVTGTNLLFMMESNLTIQASFAETSRPSMGITMPTSGQHMSNAVATITGTNSDNWGIAGVWYQLNSGVWNLVTTTTNGYKNWSQTVTLLAGTNTMKAYAMNWGGNYSLTNSVSFVSSNAFKLQLAFTNPAPLNTNGLVYSLQLSAGLNGHIQVSTNLTTWTTLTNFVGTNSVLRFCDPAATNGAQRFYRAVIP
jgi:hypothetical protein